MRNDALKLISERGKVKHSSRKVRHQRFAVSDEGEVLAPARQSMRAPYRVGFGLSESIPSTGALLRWLEGRVGQCWDRIWSELTQSLTKPGPNAEYGKHCVLRKVAVNTYFKDGQLWHNDEYHGPMALVCDWYPMPFYVHPVTRLLCCTPTSGSFRSRKLARNAAKAAERAAIFRSVSDSVQLHKAEGIWYEVQLDTIPALDTHRGYLRDAMLHTHVYFSKYALKELYGKPGVYGKSRRQLSHTELVRYKLLPALAA